MMREVPSGSVFAGKLIRSGANYARFQGEGILTVSEQGGRDIGRMEFLLTLRRRGIGDQAVLRAM